MNRRDFIKTALAGLAALVLPKGKAEAPPSTVTYADIRAMFDRIPCGIKRNSQPIFDNLGLQTHSLVKDIWVTDEWLEDGIVGPETLLGYPVAYVDGFDDVALISSKGIVVMTNLAP